LFGPFATAWKETMKSGLKHRASKAKLDRIVDVICLPLHRLPLGKISTTDVEKVLTSVWHLRETSRDTRQRIKVIFDAAIAKNLRTATIPADWDSRLKPIMAKQKKRGKVRGSHKGLPYDKLPALMQTLAGLRTTVPSARRCQNKRWPICVKPTRNGSVTTCFPAATSRGRCQTTLC
jgi:hypothetical protein